MMAAISSAGVRQAGAGEQQEKVRCMLVRDRCRAEAGGALSRQIKNVWAGRGLVAVMCSSIKFQ
jgi:hypothetical protein